jgi:hypothetical protein
MIGVRAKVRFSRVFTLEVDGRPTLAFEAEGIKVAQEIRNESWLIDDLTRLKSGGIPLRTARSKLSVRLASIEEATIFEQAAESAKPSEDMTLAYLVELDGEAKPS